MRSTGSRGGRRRVEFGGRTFALGPAGNSTNAPPILACSRRMLGRSLRRRFRIEWLSWTGSGETAVLSFFDSLPVRK